MLSAVTASVTGVASEPARPATPDTWRLSVPSTTSVSGVFTYMPVGACERTDNAGAVESTRNRRDAVAALPAASVAVTTSV